MLNSRLVSVSSDASQHQIAEEELVYQHTPSKVSLTPLKDDDASGYGGDGFSSKCSPASPGGSVDSTPGKDSTTFRIDLETREEDYLRFGHKHNFFFLFHDMQGLCTINKILGGRRNVSREKLFCAFPPSNSHVLVS